MQLAEQKTYVLIMFTRFVMANTLNTFILDTFAGENAIKNQMDFKIVCVFCIFT